jgi:hypothetical protein
MIVSRVPSSLLSVTLVVVGAAGCGGGGSDDALTHVDTAGAGGGAVGGGNGGQAVGGGNGGQAVGGGNGGQAVGGGSGGNVTAVDCTFTVNSEVSDVIPTVGIVQWSVDLPTVDSARIEFGLDTGYGLTAPVDLDEPNYRTLLLGMKASREYHFRVVARGGGSECASEDFTVTTGPIPNQIARIDVTTYSPEALAGGYIVTGTYQTGPAYIIDADGDYVWWYDMGEVTRARMSYDGKYMWMAKGNVPQGTARVIRVSMDGLDVEDFSSQFRDQNHDFAVLPDETIVYIAYGGSCDNIMERSPDGTVRQIINAGEADGGTTCHVNSIHYFAQDDTITFSDTTQSCYVKVTRQGRVVWVLGGNRSSFAGDGAQWNGNHGHHVFASDRMLIFNNGGTGSGAVAFEVLLDLSAMTATRVWEYSSGNSSYIMGDVQRLYNGNTLVTYSASGVIHEVSADGSLLQELSWDLGGAIGYVMKRRSLYGPPPK